jgi:hypothetical protein
MNDSSEWNLVLDLIATLIAHDYQKKMSNLNKEKRQNEK